MLALEEPAADWNIAYRGRPINSYWIRNRLKGLVNAPEHERRWKVEKRTVRGYRKEHFRDAMERYLPADELNQSEPPEDKTKIISSISTPESIGTIVTALKNKGENEVTMEVTMTSFPTANGAGTVAGGAPVKAMSSSPGIVTEIPVI